MIARHLGFPQETALAIRSLDEHYNGRGHPDGLKGDQIPILARVLNLAQTVEVFLRKFGVDAAMEVARKRSGKWFDPALVRALLATRKDTEFWQQMMAADFTSHIHRFEPSDSILNVNDDLLDRFAEGFGAVIDAKSPWTFRHSEGVATIATGIGEVMGLPRRQLADIRRAALLHDIGKLGISNLILDKKGRLTDEEMKQMREHPRFTHHILSRVPAFAHLAHAAADHHEKLDGSGYYRGLSGDQLSPFVRILGVADMYEALSAKRPYRQDLSEGEVLTILTKDVGKSLCPRVFEALKVFLDRSKYEPIKLAA